MVGVIAAQGHVEFAPAARPTRARIPCPSGFQVDDLWAFEVTEGAPYPPMAQGWIVIAYRASVSQDDYLPGELYVCKRAGSDECLLRTIEPGRVPGTWDLHSPFAAPMRNVGLEWASLVILFYSPHALE